MTKTNILAAALSILVAVTAALLGIIFFSGQDSTLSDLQQSEEKSSLTALGTSTCSNASVFSLTEQLPRYAYEYIYNPRTPLKISTAPYNVKSLAFDLPTAQNRQSDKTEEKQIKNTSSTENGTISEQTLQQAIQILQSVGNTTIGEDILSQLRELGLNDEQIEMIQNFPSSVEDDPQIQQEDASSQQNSLSSSSEKQLIPDNSGNWQPKTSTQEFPFWLIAIIVAVMLTFGASVILWMQKKHKKK